MHIIDIHLAAIILNTKHIHIANGLADNYALATVALNKVILVLYLLSLFKAQFGTQILHLFFQIFKKFCKIAP